MACGNVLKISRQFCFPRPLPSPTASLNPVPRRHMQTLVSRALCQPTANKQQYSPSDPKSHGEERCAAEQPHTRCRLAQAVHITRGGYPEALN